MRDTETTARPALDAANAGARVLVIRNTVDQAVALHCAIEALNLAAPLLAVDGVPCPHHGRFAAEDRRLLDQAVEAIMGKGAPTDGCIICATQTVEQSLDIDADYLISDLCPIDVLLQRIGRLHRHLRSDRPADFAVARCRVLMPEALAPAAGLLRFGLGPNREGGGVYPDITGLEAVRRSIGTGATWVIPDDNRSLVEAGTAPQKLNALAADLGSDWVAARDRTTGSKLAKAQVGRMNLIDRSRPFDGTIDDGFPDDTRILTRIGANRVEVPFPAGAMGPFGRPVSAISVPGHWHIDGLADATGDEWQESGPARLVHAAAGLVYDRFGLLRLSPT